MRAFGIVMALFGCAIALIGLYQVSQIGTTDRLTCSPSGTTSSPQTTCFYGTDNDPNTAVRASGLGIATAVVGAGFVAGGLACAGAGGRTGSQRTSYAPPIGGAPAYSEAPGGTPPAYGRQAQASSTPPPSSNPQPWGTSQP